MSIRRRNARRTRRRRLLRRRLRELCFRCLQAALARYEVALAAWRARQRQTGNHD
jgi:hypothetical protein